MSPEFQLAMGCFLLSLTITYAWWSRIRVLLLQLDLAQIANDYRASRADRGLQDDERSRVFLESLDRLMDAAPLLSPAVIGPIARLSDGDLAGGLGPDAEPFLRLLLDEDGEPDSPELRFAIWKVALRVARYLAFETATGWMSILRALFLGIEDVPMVARQRIEESKNTREVRALMALFSRGRSRRVA